MNKKPSTQTFYLLLITLLFTFSLGGVSSAPCKRECGTFTPLNWINSHITDLITVGIASPIATSVASPVDIFRIPAAQNFFGLAGCRPKTISTLNETATVQYSGSCDLISSQTTNFRPRVDDPFLGSTFPNLTVTYVKCTPRHKNLRYLGKRAMKSYTHQSTGFPTGLMVNFTFDAECRVKTAATWDLGLGVGGVITNTANISFQYPAIQSGGVWWLPQKIRRKSKNAVTTQNTTYQLDSVFKNILQLNTTIKTVNVNNGTKTQAPNIQEYWNFSYNQIRTTLISATVQTLSRTSPTNSRYDFVYDSRGRWTSLNFTNTDVGSKPSPIYTVTYPQIDRVSTFTFEQTDVQINFSSF